MIESGKYADVRIETREQIRREQLGAFLKQGGKPYVGSMKAFDEDALRSHLVGLIMKMIPTEIISMTKRQKGQRSARVDD